MPRRPDLDFGPGSYSTCPGGGSETPGVPCGRGRERVGGIYSATIQSSASMSVWLASQGTKALSAVFIPIHGSNLA